MGALRRPGLLRRVAIFLYLAVWGCAYPSTLVPLTVEPIPGDSAEYTLTLFRWKPGIRVVTRTTILGEGRVKERTERYSNDSVTIETAEQVTARGLVQVATLWDGKTHGTFFYDERGRLVDVSVVTADEALSDIAPALGPMALGIARVRERLDSKTLTRDAPVRFDVPILDVMGPSTKPIGEVKAVAVSYTFVGYRMLKGQRVAEVRIAIDLSRAPVEITIEGRISPTVLSFSLEGSEFLAPDSGLRVGAFGTSRFSFMLAGKDVTVKMSYRSTIDTRASKGIN